MLYSVKHCFLAHLTLFHVKDFIAQFTNGLLPEEGEENIVVDCLSCISVYVFE